MTSTTALLVIMITLAIAFIGNDIMYHLIRSDRAYHWSCPVDGCNTKFKADSETTMEYIKSSHRLSHELDTNN